MCLLGAFLGLQHLSKWALAGALAQSPWGRLEEIKEKEEKKNIDLETQEEGGDGQRREERKK